MADTTTVMALPFPEGSDANDVPADMQALAERLDEAPGTTAAEKSANYKQMVKDMLRALVVEADLRDAREAANAAIRDAEAAARDNADNV